MMPSLKTQIHWFTRAQQALLGAVLLAGILFFMGVYRPATARLEHLTGQISQSERALAVSQLQTRALPAVQADINRLEAKLADFKKLPATPGDLGQFQIEIAQLGRRDNLRGWSVSWPGTPRRSDQYYELPVSVKFSGNFRDVFAFLCQIEDLPRLTRITSMVVKATDAGGGVQVDLLMNLYYSEG
ncbi:MAG: type 4a pilus biogenesis protein PilO [Tepidisphaeraceae bacterium]